MYRMMMIIPLALLAIFLTAGTTPQAKKVPKVVVVKACAKKKPPVKFAHKTHTKKQKIKCATCHHKKDAKAYTCSSAKCHAGKAKGKVPGCAEMSKKKNPYHIQCIGCHSSKGKGPKSCAECHKKVAP